MGGSAAGNGGGLAGRGGTSGASGAGARAFGAPEKLIQDLESPSRLVQDGSRIIVTVAGLGDAATGSILSVPKAGGDVEVLADMRATPYGLAVFQSQVFWIETGEQGAIYALAPGEGPKVLIEGLQRPSMLAADEARLYWGELGGPGEMLECGREYVLGWADHDGSNRGGPFAGEFCSVRDLALLPARGELVVADSIGYGLLATLNLSSGELNGWLEAPAEDVAAVSSDEIVFTAPAARAVWRVGWGSTGSAVVEDLVAPYGIATHGEWVYFTERLSSSLNGTEQCLPTGSVKAVPLSGGEPVVIADGLLCPSRIEADDDAVYWIVNGEYGEANGSVMRAAILR